MTETRFQFVPYRGGGPATQDLLADLTFGEASSVDTASESMGAPVLAGSAADFGKLIADETEKWGKVVKCRRSLTEVWLFLNRQSKKHD
jgi:hypothetical protein